MKNVLLILVLFYLEALKFSEDVTISQIPGLIYSIKEVFRRGWHTKQQLVLMYWKSSWSAWILLGPFISSQARTPLLPWWPHCQPTIQKTSG